MLIVQSLKRTIVSRHILNLICSHSKIISCLQINYRASSLFCSQGGALHEVCRLPVASIIFCRCSVTSQSWLSILEKLFSKAYSVMSLNESTEHIIDHSAVATGPPENELLNFTGYSAGNMLRLGPAPSTPEPNCA